MRFTIKPASSRAGTELLDVPPTSVTGETNMFRKTILAVAATTAIGAAALLPTTASAAWSHGGWHGPSHHWRGGSGFSISFGAPAYAPYYAYAPRCYVVRRVVRTQWGPRWRPVRVCR
jgi:hypothetical protein